MFGSDFLSNFGIPTFQDFPLQGTDAQGGLFGPNAPQLPFDQPGGMGATGDTMAGIPGGPSAPQQLPFSGAPSPGSPAQPQQKSPLSAGGGTPLGQGDLMAAPGQHDPYSTPGQNAPAAGIGTEFRPTSPGGGRF